LISSVMLSGTFAKYTSEYAGEDTALVARWSFTAQGSSNNIGDLGDMGSATELALFDHYYDTHINGTSTDGTYIIAPGVEDEFMIKMDYLADVDADVEIAFETLPGSAAVPIEYCVVRDGQEDTWVTLTGLAEELANKIIAKALDTATATESAPAATESAPAANGIFRIKKVANSEDAAVSISETVKWRWAYDNAAQAAGGTSEITSSDSFDTGLGEASVLNAAGRSQYGIKVTLTATQVTPATGDETEIETIGVIEGSTTVGTKLTAGALGPLPAEGSITASYQWQRSDSANGAFSDIAGATFNEYTTQIPDDVGKYIRVVATGTGDYTNTVRSAPVGPIEAAEED
jgi:hypothetical protein